MERGCSLWASWAGSMELWPAGRWLGRGKAWPTRAGATVNAWIRIGDLPNEMESGGGTNEAGRGGVLARLRRGPRRGTAGDKVTDGWLAGSVAGTAGTSASDDEDSCGELLETKRDQGAREAREEEGK